MLLNENLGTRQPEFTGDYITPLFRVAVRAALISDMIITVIGTSRTSVGIGKSVPVECERNRTIGTVKFVLEREEK
jgi:hypothetical protein